MKKLSIFSVTLISISMAFSSIASASPAFERQLQSNTQMTPADISLAQYDGRHRPHSANPHRPGARPNYPAARPGRPHARPPAHTRPDYGRPNRPHAGRPHNRPGYYHGHQGSRHKRKGYRRHKDGWWYPIAAFTAGAIIGGTAAQ